MSFINISEQMQKLNIAYVLKPHETAHVKGSSLTDNKSTMRKLFHQILQFVEF